MKRAMAVEHACAVCPRSIPRGKLMCPSHWRLVPGPLQVEVWRTWRSLSLPRAPHDGIDRLAAYRNAVAAAVDAVTPSHPQPGDSNG